MRPIGCGFAIAALLLTAPPARADDANNANDDANDKKGGAAFVAGAASFVLGFMVGGLLLATADGRDSVDNAGWLTLEAGFALAPIASHAVTGEWARGVAFAAPAAAAVAGTATLFAVEPSTVLKGALPEQRVLWSMVAVAMLSGTAGVVDAALADGRPGPTAKGATHIAVAPSLGHGELGLQIEGTL